MVNFSCNIKITISVEELFGGHTRESCIKTGLLLLFVSHCRTKENIRACEPIRNRLWAWVLFFCPVLGARLWSQGRLFRLAWLCCHTSPFWCRALGRRVCTYPRLGYRTAFHNTRGDGGGFDASLRRSQGFSFSPSRTHAHSRDNSAMPNAPSVLFLLRMGHVLLAARTFRRWLSACAAA